MSGPSEWALDRAEAIAALRHADGTRYGDVIDLADALDAAREDGRRAGIEAAEAEASKLALLFLSRSSGDIYAERRMWTDRFTGASRAAMAIRSLLTTTPAAPGGENDAR